VQQNEDMKGEIEAANRFLLTVSLVIALVYLPLRLYGQERATAPSPSSITGQANPGIPPVEQPLVPEEVFAIQLAQAFKFGQVQDEAEAGGSLGDFKAVATAKSRSEFHRFLAFPLHQTVTTARDGVSI
jgi:hypothetical protein